MDLYGGTGKDEACEIHQIFNDGEDDLEFLAISAPAWIPGDSFFTSEQLT